MVHIVVTLKHIFTCLYDALELFYNDVIYLPQPNSDFILIKLWPYTYIINIDKIAITMSKYILTSQTSN